MTSVDGSTPNTPVFFAAAETIVLEFSVLFAVLISEPLVVVVDGEVDVEVVEEEEEFVESTNGGRIRTNALLSP